MTIAEDFARDNRVPAPLRWGQSAEAGPPGCPAGYGGHGDPMGVFVV